MKILCLLDKYSLDTISKTRYCFSYSSCVKIVHWLRNLVSRRDLPLPLQPTNGLMNDETSDIRPLFIRHKLQLLYTQEKI